VNTASGNFEKHFDAYKGMVVDQQSIHTRCQWLTALKEKIISSEEYTAGMSNFPILGFSMTEQ
jgi:hypothetical protein